MTPKSGVSVPHCSPTARIRSAASAAKSAALAGWASFRARCTSRIVVGSIPRQAWRPFGHRMPRRSTPAMPRDPHRRAVPQTVPWPPGMAGATERREPCERVRRFEALRPPLAKCAARILRNVARSSGRALWQASPATGPTATRLARRAPAPGGMPRTLACGHPIRRKGRGPVPPPTTDRQGTCQRPTTAYATRFGGWTLRACGVRSMPARPGPHAPRPLESDSPSGSPDRRSPSRETTSVAEERAGPLPYALRRVSRRAGVCRRSRTGGCATGTP